MNEKPPKQDAPNTQREANGQFAKGNSGGPGNPHARRVAQLRELLYEEIPQELMRLIIRKLGQMALGGDLHAMKILFSYQFGKPGPYQDPDLLDKQELDLATQTTASVPEALKTMQCLVPSLAIDILRTTKPHLHKGHADLAAQHLAELKERDALEAEEDGEADLEDEDDEGQRDEFLQELLDDIRRRRTDRKRSSRPKDQARDLDRDEDNRPPSPR